jgi:lysozyme family protein
MKAFDAAFLRIIGHEGGYVNHPNDPGGETKYGISKRAYPNENIAMLTLERAKFLYKRDYWDAARADEYHPAIGFQLFDAAINSGVFQAAKWLQMAVDVKVDGKIGPISISAINDTPVAVVLLRFNAARLRFMASLGTWPTFGKGWANRIAGNLDYSAKDL